jgi:hypothetical protein
VIDHIGRGIGVRSAARPGDRSFAFGRPVRSLAKIPEPS